MKIRNKNDQKLIFFPIQHEMIRFNDGFRSMVSRWTTWRPWRAIWTSDIAVCDRNRSRISPIWCPICSTTRRTTATSCTARIWRRPTTIASSSPCRSIVKKNDCQMIGDDLICNALFVLRAAELPFCTPDQSISSAVKHIKKTANGPLGPTRYILPSKGQLTRSPEPFFLKKYKNLTENDQIYKKKWQKMTKTTKI